MLKQLRAIPTTIKCVLGTAFLCATALPSNALGTVLIDEPFDSGYNRTVNDILNSNLAMFKGRSGTTATVNVGSVSYSGAGAGSTMYWSYFTDPGANISGIGGASSVNNGHLLLGVGDTLTVSASFSLSAMPGDLSAYALRFGLFDNYINRQTADANSGGTSVSFTNNPGYAVFVPMSSLSSTTAVSNMISIRSHTTMTTANIFTTSGDYTGIGSTVGGNYNPLSSDNNYTFQFSVARPDGSTWVLSSSIIDTVSQTVMTSGSVTTNTGLTSFNWFAWRTPNDTAGGINTFTDLNVTVIPEPSTVVLVGTGLGLAMMAIRRRRH